METKTMIIIFGSLGGVLLIGLALVLCCLCGKKKTEEIEQNSKNFGSGEVSHHSNTIHSNDVKIEITSNQAQNDENKNNFVQLDQTSQIHSNYSVSLVGSDRKMLDSSSLIASSMRKDEENKGAERDDKKEEQKKQDKENNEENEEDEGKEGKKIIHDKENTLEDKDKANQPNSKEQCLEINELKSIKELSKESEPELLKGVIPIKKSKLEIAHEGKKDNGIISNEKESIKQNDLVSMVRKRDIEKIEKNVNINDLDSQNSRIKKIFQRYSNHGTESNNDEIEEEDKSEESGQENNGHMSYEESKRPNQGEDNDVYLESNEYDNPELENEIKNQIGKYIMDQKEIKSIQSSVQESNEDIDSISANNKIEKDLTSQEHSEIFTEE